MKKVTKLLTISAGLAALLAAVSFVRDYRKMKKMQAKLEKLPFGKLRNKMTHVHHEEDRTIIEIPKKIGWIEKALLCAKVLKA